MNKRQIKKYRKRGCCFHYKEFESLYEDFCNSAIMMEYNKTRNNFAALRCICHDIKQLSKYYVYKFTDHISNCQNTKTCVIDIKY